jgi:hypothetical protein
MSQRVISKLSLYQMVYRHVEKRALLELTMSHLNPLILPYPISTIQRVLNLSRNSIGKV